MADELPEAVLDVIADIIAAERKEWVKDRERNEAESRVIIAELRAEVANLKTSNEMLRVDVRRSVETEIERMQAVAANVKDGRDGVDGAPGAQGERGDTGPQGEKGDTGPDGPRGERGETGQPGVDGAPGADGKDADPELIVSTAEDAVQKAFAALPVPKDGRDGVDGTPGADGKDADPELIALACTAAVQKAIAASPAPKDGRDGVDGKDADPEFVVKLVSEAVGDAVAAIPAPKDGRDGVDGTPGAEGPAGPPGAPGLAGKDADVDYARIQEAIEAVTLRGVEKEVVKQLAELPPPESGPPGRDGIDGKPGDIGPEGRPGKDAAAIVGAFKTHDGRGVLTLEDGRVLDLGVVQGKDGAPGRDGADGQAGRDGKDGLSFDAFDLEPEYDGERSLRLKWLNSAGQQQMREWRLPFVIYRGIHSAERTYELGDMVTWAGSCWHAEKDNPGKPGDPDSGWRLAVKEGRAGKNGEPGKTGSPGLPGRPGRDLTLGGV